MTANPTQPSTCLWPGCGATKFKARSLCVQHYNRAELLLMIPEARNAAIDHAALPAAWEARQAGAARPTRAALIKAGAVALAEKGPCIWPGCTSVPNGAACYKHDSRLRVLYGTVRGLTAEQLDQAGGVWAQRQADRVIPPAVHRHPVPLGKVVSPTMTVVKAPELTVVQGGPNGADAVREERDELKSIVDELRSILLPNGYTGVDNELFEAARARARQDKSSPYLLGSLTGALGIDMDSSEAAIVAALVEQIDGRNSLKTDLELLREELVEVDHSLGLPTGRPKSGFEISIRIDQRRTRIREGKAALARVDEYERALTDMGLPVTPSAIRLLVRPMSEMELRWRAAKLAEADKLLTQALAPESTNHLGVHLTRKAEVTS